MEQRDAELKGAGSGLQTVLSPFHFGSGRDECTAVSPSNVTRRVLDGRPDHIPHATRANRQVHVDVKEPGAKGVDVAAAIETPVR